MSKITKAITLWEEGVITGRELGNRLLSDIEPDDAFALVQLYQVLERLKQDAFSDEEFKVFWMGGSQEAFDKATKDFKKGLGLLKEAFEKES